MADISDEQQSEVTRITGGDEENIVDVELGFDGKNRLLVKSETSISSDLQIIQNYDLDQTLDDVTYFDIYTGVGVVTVSGFSLEFSDKKIYVRLEIDGVEIFDINVERLKDISDWNAASQPQTYISWNDGLKVFYFTPNFPIKSTTGIKIQARSKLGQSKKYKASIIQVG